MGLSVVFQVFLDGIAIKRQPLSHKRKQLFVSLFLPLTERLTFITFPFTCLPGLPQWLSGQESACSAEDAGDTSSIPGSGRSSGGACGNPLQYSCLENPMHRKTWWATVHKVTKSWIQRKWLSRHALLLLGYELLESKAGLYVFTKHTVTVGLLLAYSRSPTSIYELNHRQNVLKITGPLFRVTEMETMPTLLSCSEYFTSS